MGSSIAKILDIFDNMQTIDKKTEETLLDRSKNPDIKVFLINKREQISNPIMDRFESSLANTSN